MLDGRGPPGSLQPMARGPLPHRWVLAAFGVGLALQLLQAWVVGDQDWMPQHVAQFAAGAAVWWFATWPRARGFLRWVAVVAAAVLPLAWGMAVLGVAPGWIPAQGWRSSLWWGNPHLLGIMLASTVALASVLVTRARWTVLVLGGAALVVTVANWSRGATVALLLGLVTWAWTRVGWRGRVWLAAGAGVVGLAILASIAYGPEGWSALFSERTAARFFDGSVVDPDGRGGVFGRLRSHDAASVIVTASWPWGVGQAGFADAYRTLVAPDARYALGHAHHQVLQLLAVGGLPGLLAWLLPLAAAVWGLSSRAWWVLAPFLAVQAFFWGTEAPLLNSGAFYATWVALALGRQVSRGTWPVSPPCEEQAGRAEPITASRA